MQNDLVEALQGAWDAVQTLPPIDFTDAEVSELRTALQSAGYAVVRQDDLQAIADGRAGIKKARAMLQAARGGAV